MELAVREVVHGRAVKNLEALANPALRAVSLTGPSSNGETHHARGLAPRHVVFEFRHGAGGHRRAHGGRRSAAECCGLLVGAGDSVDESVRTPNIEPGLTRFLVDLPRRWR